MISRWEWLLKQVSRQLWLRVTIIATIGVLTAVSGIILGPYVPLAWTPRIGPNAIDAILQVLASSMLTVTVFSLSTMVAAYSAATTNVTPPATKLLLEDDTSQNVLGTFIGAFLFSLVGLIALNTGLYGDQGRAILLVVTIGLVGLISVTILRWIDYLARFGRVDETIARVEAATWMAMEARLKHPCLGGQAWSCPSPEAQPGGTKIYSATVGYVKHVDVARLQACAIAKHGEIFLTALPGAFVHPTRPIAIFRGKKDTVDKTNGADFADAFTIGDTRTFDQDPRFGLCVLSEIASRALSPAVNDPGTAIDVIGRAVRLLVNWADFDRSAAAGPVECPQVWVPAIEVGDMLNDTFAPIARDGAALVEVHIRLQKAFAALALAVPERLGIPAKRQSELAIQHAEVALRLESDKAVLRALAGQV